MYVKKFVPYHLRDYILKVIFPCLVVTILSIPIPLFLKRYSDDTISTILLIAFTVIMSGSIVLLTGMDKNEKQFFKSMINKIIRR